MLPCPCTVLIIGGTLNRRPIIASGPHSGGLLASGDANDASRNAAFLRFQTGTERDLNYRTLPSNRPGCPVFWPVEEVETSLSWIVSLVPAKTKLVMPLILAGLLPLVSLGGIMTMNHEEDGLTSIATDPGPAALTGPREDAGFDGGDLDGGRLNEEPQRDGGTSYPDPGSEATEPTANEDEDDSEAPGKTEESPGQPRTPGEGEGHGQDNADENGRGPDH